MTSSIMHSCDESDDSLRITSVEVEVEFVITNKASKSCDTRVICLSVRKTLPMELLSGSVREGIG